MSSFSNVNEKQALIESFAKATKSGIRIEVQSAFTQLLQAYNNSFLLLFKENAMQTNNTLIQGAMSVIQTTDDFSLSFLNSADFIDLLNFLASVKYSSTENSPILKAFEIIKVIDIFETVPNLSTANSHFIELLKLIMSHVPSNEILLSETSCILIERYLTILPDQTATLKSYSDKYRSNTTTYLRFCSIVSKLISKNDFLFTTCVQTGCVDMIWSCCKTDDILTQIVAIEYIRYMADTQAGLTYLFTSTEGIFAWLVTIAHDSFVDTNTDTDHYSSVTHTNDPVLVSQCLREVSEIFNRASTHHILNDAIWSLLTNQEYLKKFLKSTLMHIDGVKEETRLTGLKVITDFATASPKALALIVNDSMLLTAWVELINSSKVDLQAVALHSYARVMEHDYRCTPSHTAPVDSNTNSGYSNSNTNSNSNSNSNNSSGVSGDVDALKVRLWQSVGEVKRAPTTLSYLLRLAHQPISNLRHASLDLLQAVLRYDLTTTTTTTNDSNNTYNSNNTSTSKGLQLLCLSADFRAYLVDQESESTKEGREWKYALVQAVARHPQLDTLVCIFTTSGVGSGSTGSDWVSELRRVEGRGPHYKPPQMSEMVTMEH